ncbi:MAG: CxxC motif-containing protein (DUF1111 family) [Luteibaculaceae bacterium]|jgi:CxxC motif-containing protein (DUF1111 family)
MRLHKLGLIGLLLTLALACSKLMPEAPTSNEVLDGPIKGLSPAQLRKHIIGDEEFAHTFSELDGLGPIFVQNSCESCHIGDGKGNPFNNLTRFGKYNPDSTWNSMIQQGGPQLQHRAISGHQAEKVPTGAESAQFIGPTVSGLGYLAAVEDASILAMADPTDINGDGISGIVNEIDAPDWLIIDERYHQALPNGKYIGRFGRKAAAINLLMQTVGAFKQDMGITSDFDTEDPINYATSTFGGDGTPNPEVSGTTVGNVVFYLQTLKAPERREENKPEVKEGKAIFNNIGCNNCHTPTLSTGPSEIEALNRVSFAAYTDMLLHDMGPELDDNYTEGIVGTREWRTMPLWGLGLQKDSQGASMFLLHDGRAGSYQAAIDLHGGEAANSRTQFQSLSSGDKDKVIAFLNSL